MKLIASINITIPKIANTAPRPSNLIVVLSNTLFTFTPSFKNN